MTTRSEVKVTFTGPEQVALHETTRTQPALRPDEVMGRTVASIVSVGTELATLVHGPAGTTFPFTPGYAAVFEVERIGPEVTKVQIGDLALCMGPHASLQRHPQEAVLKVPDGLAPETAVFARLMGVSMSALTTTTARPPARVLVTGLGLVGNLAAQVFQTCGYEVLACDPSEARCRLARRVGIRKVRPSVPVDGPTVGGTIALVVECSGHEQAVLDGCRVVQPQGEVVLVGVPWSRTTALSAHDLLSPIFHRYVRLRSGWEWELPLHPTPFRANSIFGNLDGALRWLVEGRMNVEGLSRTVSPREAPQVYAELLAHQHPALTATFDWTWL